MTTGAWPGKNSSVRKGPSTKAESLQAVDGPVIGQGRHDEKAGQAALCRPAPAKKRKRNPEQERIYKVKYRKTHQAEIQVAKPITAVWMKGD